MEASASLNIEGKEKVCYERILQLVQTANQFDSYIVLETSTTVINCKSLISTSAFLKAQDKITIRAVGRDSQEAVSLLQGFIEKKIFTEERSSYPLLN
ncbi:HPr family phosphocarrier protein [Thalassorhabdus alkalitolerans]|uniref:HPr family phosphocarrier protein n=1 Tax=Thalassorhabdus alkalitolerans TaxID=2282697 RepID=A0ABW0YKP8_9BACI